MADLKISQLPTSGALNLSDLFAIVNAGVTSKITYSNLLSELDADLTTKTLAQTLASGNVTGGNNIVMSNGDTISDAGGDVVIDTGSGVYFSATRLSVSFYLDATEISATFSGTKYLSITAADISLIHDTKLLFNSPIYNFTSLTASRTPYIDASNNLVAGKVTLTQPATGSTITIADGKTLTVSDTTSIGTNSITFAGGEVITFTATNALTFTTTGATNITLPTTGTLAAITDVYFSITSGLVGLLSPADSTTYYFGPVNIIPNATDTNFSYNIGYAVTIIGAIVTVAANTASGSTENNVLQIRNITQATSSSCGNFLSNGSATLAVSTTFTGLNIALAAGDSFCYQLDTPAYTVNPVGFRISVTLILKRTS